jgi:hypothetical protein
LDSTHVGDAPTLPCARNVRLIMSRHFGASNG